MRILLVEPYGTRIGHFGLYATHIAQELALLGHKVVLVTGTRVNTREFLQGRPPFRVLEAGLSNRVLSADSSVLPRRLRRVMHGPSVIQANVAALTEAIQLCASERVDVMHLLDTEAISAAAILSWSSIVRRQRLPPLVVQIFPVDFSFSAHVRNPLRGVYKLIARRAFRFIIRRFCSRVIVQGEWHRPRIMRQLGFDEVADNTFVVVRPGTPLPQPRLTRAEARLTLLLDPSATVFLFFGMLRCDKGIDLLLDAAGELRGNWQLLIAGAPYDWTVQTLLKKIARCKQPERVFADIRYIPEAECEAYFAAADAVVLPYRGKNYPGNYGPMVLACGHGKPVIVSNVGEMGSLAGAYRLGYAVPPDDACALRDAMQAFICLPAAARAEMSANARWLAEECSFSRAARVLSEIYAAISATMASQKIL